jgi:hypothetical protein
MSVGAGPNARVDVSRPNLRSYWTFLVLTLAVVAFFALLAVSAYQGFLVDRWANQTNAVVSTLAVIEIIVLWTFAARWMAPITRDPPMALTVKGRILELQLRSGRITSLNLEAVWVQSWMDNPNKPGRLTASPHSPVGGWSQRLRPTPWFDLTPDALDAIQSEARSAGLRTISTPLKDLAKRGERIQFVT